MLAQFSLFYLDMARKDAIVIAEPGMDAYPAARRWNERHPERFKHISPSAARDELRGYGAWCGAELSDHDENLTRIAWLAACEIRERTRNEHDKDIYC